MADKRKSIIENILCVTLILLVGLLRLFCRSNHKISLNGMNYILYITAIFIWMGQVKRRLIYDEERKYLLWMGRMLIGLMMIRTIKFIFLPPNHILVRYFWYLYYVPQTFMVLFMFFAVWHIGKRADEKIPRKYNWLYIPAVLLCIGILTNDYHQLAFHFERPITMWQDTDPYQHMVLYYLSLIWMALLFIAMLVIAVRRCAVSENRCNLWMPILPLVIGVVYTLMFLHNPDGIFAMMYKTSEMLVIVFPAFMEGLIQAHLFPSNDNYEVLWNISSIGGGIMTEQGEIHYCSAPKLTVNLDSVIQAKVQDVPLEDPDKVLRSHAIRGGYGYWIKDVHVIRQLNQQLMALGDVLAEENAILAGENRLRKQKERVQRENVLYDTIATILKPRLSQLQQWIDAPYENEAAFQERMRYACVLNVYLKRYSNLYLQTREKTLLPVEELYLSIQESLIYVEHTGVKTYVNCSEEMQIPASQILLAYELFEECVEKVLMNTNAIFVVIAKESGWELRLNADAPLQISDFARYEKALTVQGGSLKIEEEEDSTFLTLSFRMKGGDDSYVIL